MALMAPSQANNQPSVSVQQLFELDNPKNSAELLGRHLGQAAGMCDVFGLFGHTVADLEKGAVKLVEFECYTLKDLVNRDDVFVDAKWKLGQETLARKAVQDSPPRQARSPPQGVP